MFGDSGGNVVFASLKNHEQIKMIKKKRFHNGIVINCKISLDKKSVVTSSTDQSVKIFSFQESGVIEEMATINQHNGWVWDLHILNDNKHFLTASSDSRITAWELSTGNFKKSAENDVSEGGECLGYLEVSGYMEIF